MVSASNTTLSIENGMKLAIVDDKGNIVRQGEDVSKEIFDAMTEQVVRNFCSKFSGFTEADFKESA
jgi:hypothetical protein